MMEQIFKSHIEQLFQNFKNTNDFMAKEISPITYELYLQGAYYLISNTVPCLELAISKSRHSPLLAQFFSEKIDEEAGHENWAKSDFEKTFGRTFNSPTVTPSMKKLVDWLYTTIERNPNNYLAYILYIEYLTVLYGEMVEMRFKEAVKSPTFSCVILAAHVELDKEHIIDDLKAITELFTNSQSDIQELKEAITQAHNYLSEFYSEITKLGTYPETELSA